MNVAVEDHHDGFAAVIFQLPKAPLGVDQPEGGSQCADRGPGKGGTQDPRRSIESWTSIGAAIHAANFTLPG